MDTNNPILTVEQAASYVGLSASTLNKARCLGGRATPKFLKLTARRVGYRKSDLDVWLTSRTRTSTSDRGGDHV